MYVYVAIFFVDEIFVAVFKEEEVSDGEFLASS